MVREPIALSLAHSQARNKQLIHLWELVFSFRGKRSSASEINTTEGKEGCPNIMFSQPHKAKGCLVLQMPEGVKKWDFQTIYFLLFNSKNKEKWGLNNLLCCCCCCRYCGEGLTFFAFTFLPDDFNRFYRRRRKSRNYLLKQKSK